MIRSAAAFWTTYLATLPPDHPHRRARVSVFAFGDSAALARELAVLVRAGQKRATASLPVEFTAAGDPLPTVGDVDIVTLADGEPVCIIETTEVRLVAYFGRVCGRLGGHLDDATLILCRRFRLLYQRP